MHVFLLFSQLTFLFFFFLTMVGWDKGTFTLTIYGHLVETEEGHRSVHEVDHICSPLGNTCRGLLFSRKRECAPFRGKQPGKGVNWIPNRVRLVRHKQNINLHHLTKKRYHSDENYDCFGQKRDFYMGETRGKQGETRYTTAEMGLNCIKDTQPYNRSYWEVFLCKITRLMVVSPCFPLFPPCFPLVSPISHNNICE